MKTKVSATILFLSISLTSFGGGIVTNTNQSAAWVRMYARDASQSADAVYYNPAGLTALKAGLHLSINNQALFSTRTIYNDYKYLNTNEYKGDVSAPFFPGVYAAYSTGKFVFSLGFNPVGGGGNATYKKGLPSFELAVSDLVPGLSPKGAIGYRSDVYFKGSSVFYGTQLGASYKVNEMVSVFLGARYVYAVNKYQGHLKSNTIELGTKDSLASDYFMNASKMASGGAAGVQPLVSGGAGSLTLIQAQGANLISATQKAQIEGGLIALGINPTGQIINAISYRYKRAAFEYGNKSKLLRDQEANVTQTGSGLNPIIGLNLNLMDNKLNIGMKYEFITKIKLKNDTKRDITTGYVTDTLNFVNTDSITQFPHGAKTSSDMPALFTFGASYQVFKSLKVSGGVHYYFDKAANYGRSKNGLVVENDQVINTNNYELAFGAEYKVSEKILVSAGYLFTKTGVMVGYNTDLSYSLGSNSIGFGTNVAITSNIDLDLGFSYTKYVPDSKTFEHTIPTTPPQLMSVNEDYGKDVLIFAIGFNVKL